MRRKAIVRSVRLPLLLVLVTVAAASGANTSTLVQSSALYASSMTPLGEAPSYQTKLVALMAAASETGIKSLTELDCAFREMAPSVVYLKSSDTSFTWESEEWVPVTRSSYTYNANDQLTQLIAQLFSGSTWVNTSKTVITYDGSHRASTSTSQIWQGGAWVNQSMTTYSYDGSGNQTQMLNQIWQGGAWVNYRLTTYTYSSGRVSAVVVQEWETGAWVNSMRYEYTYTGSGFVSVWLMQQWQTSAWENMMRFLYTYDSNDWEIESVSQMWKDSDWENAMRNEYTYDGSGHEILTVGSMWATVDWMLTDADTTKWSGDLMTEIVTYDILSSSLTRMDFWYDGNGNEIENIYQTFTDPDWMNESRNVYVYQVGLDADLVAEAVPMEFSLGQNYPNPFNPTTSIRYSLTKRSEVRLTVLNVLGEEVRVLEDAVQSPGVYEAVWDGTDSEGRLVSTGIYFYRISANGLSETKKMVLMK